MKQVKIYLGMDIRRLGELDEIAESMSIPRSSLIKMFIDEGLNVRRRTQS